MKLNIDDDILRMLRIDFEILKYYIVQLVTKIHNG